MPYFNSSRKVQVFGSSLAVTLPAIFVKACEISKGTELEVHHNLDGVLVVSDVKDLNVLIERLLDITQKIQDKKLQEVVSTQ